MHPRLRRERGEGAGRAVAHGGSQAGRGLAGEVTQARARATPGGGGAGNGRPRVDKLRAGRDAGVGAPGASRVERGGGSKAGPGSDIWAEGERRPALGESGGSQRRPAVQTGGGPSRPGGEGLGGCSRRRRRPGARSAGSASLPGPTQKLVATNRRPRLPLAASGGVGGRARGRGRLADAAANWWADPESPRKRGRLSAVRQARLCGSGSPLLQRSPWHGPSVSAQPSGAPRAVNCSPRPLASVRLPPRPRCPKLLKTSAAARLAAPGEYLLVVRVICATLTGIGPRAWRSAWPWQSRPVRGAGAWRARGEEPVAGG